MHLIEIFLPLADNQGQRQPSKLFEQVRHELTEQYGGLTAFTRSPAKGVWQDDGDNRQQDDIVIYEVMSQALDRGWWSDYKAGLEARFKQKELVIRVHQVEIIID
ncbi:hypothetical protein TRP66_00110 [Pseudomonas sp. JDS28PS106]|uniref:hypothetical protein n=1 Tax=Pseudomonas sp. JDS28PS106 TaxID=2497235 RepID=UPI002FD5E557